MAEKPRFQTLVELHARREDEARKRLGRLEVARAALLERIVAIDAARERAAFDAAEPRLRAVYADYWARADAEIVAVAGEVRAREGEIAKARAELIEVHREHAVFSRLRDRSLAERAAVRERREARAIDDYAAARVDDRRRLEEHP